MIAGCVNPNAAQTVFCLISASGAGYKTALNRNIGDATPIGYILAERESWVLKALSLQKVHSCTNVGRKMDTACGISRLSLIRRYTCNQDI